MPPAHRHVRELAAKSAAQRGAQITLLGAARAAPRQTETGAQIGGSVRATVQLVGNAL
jgi:hypothetical protein